MKASEPKQEAYERIPRSDRRGVSTVIGVILMVTMTVVLAAVVGIFVFDLGESAQVSPPNVQLDVEWDGSDDEQLTITHASGGAVDGSELRLVGPDGTVSFDDGNDVWNVTNWDDEITAGDSGTIGDVTDVDGTSLDDGDGGTYRVVWESEGTSTIIKTFERPA